MGPGDVVMAEVWISDAEGRVLGPMPLEVVKQLAAGGHVHDIRRVSNDGKRWSTAHSFPELVPFLKSQATPADAQVQQAAKLRAQLSEFRAKPVHQVFQVAVGASFEVHQTAFFALVKRFHPARLPTDAHPDLRAACLEVFTFLGTLMAGLELQKRGPVTPSPAFTPSPVPKRLRPPAALPVSYRLGDFVGWSSGAERPEATVRVSAENAGIFLDHSLANFASGAVFVPSQYTVALGTLIELRLLFVNPSREIIARGRVILENTGALRKNISGMGVKLVDLKKEDKQFIAEFLGRIPLDGRQPLRF